jgi:FixJ family two-component response regulator
MMQTASPVVAIIDDDPSTRRALRRLVRAMAYSPSDFASGSAFLGSLSEESPRCALLDLHMPGVNGLEVLLEMRARGVRVPTIIITGNAKADMRDACFEAGAVDYLTKPLDPEVLAIAIGLAVRRSPTC